jgi:hypothetical protein
VTGIKEWLNLKYERVYGEDDTEERHWEMLIGANAHCWYRADEERQKAYVESKKKTDPKKWCDRCGGPLGIFFYDEKTDTAHCHRCARETGEI